MDQKEAFKDFVQNHPTLVNYVNNDKMTWQKFYEMFNLYGSNNEVWEPYFNRETVTKTIGLADIIAWFKNIDLDAFQENINNVGRVVSVLQDLGNKNTDTIAYNPRPIYKHFED